MTQEKLEELLCKILDALLGFAIAIGRLDILENAGFEITISPISAERNEEKDE